MRLLVATEFPPDAPGGGPAVVRQMLRGFPGEIHWWSCRAGASAPAWPGLSISSLASCEPGKLMPARRWTRLKAPLMESIWAPWAARSLRRTLRRVRPDCIWVIPHDWSIFPLHEVLVAEGAGPVRFHTTIQDYPDVHGHAVQWGEDRVTRMARMQEELYVRAASRDATSSPMLEDLRQRTGAGGVQMLHQGLEPGDFARLEPARPEGGKPACVRIAYAGTILVEREFALFTQWLGRAFHRPAGAAANDFHPARPRVELRLFSAHSYADRPWFDRSWMVEHGHLPERALIEALHECDWGFIPMALEEVDPRYNRFSFPTKFITYLAAGLPPIVLGHRQSSVMQLAEQEGVGLRIKDEQSLQQAVELLAVPQREHHLEAMKRCARRWFDAPAMRGRLWAAWRGFDLTDG